MSPRIQRGPDGFECRRWYLAAWLVIWAPLGFVGCLLGLLVGPLTSILVMGSVAAAAASLTIVSMGRRERGSTAPRSTPGARARAAAGRASGAGAATVLFGALIALLGARALPLMALAVMSSPPLVTAARRRLKPAAAPHLHRGPRTVARLETEGLCKEWRASYARVSEATSIAALAHEAGRRQEFLDEMERRNAKGFRAWLATGPRADDDPECFVHAEASQSTRRPRSNG